MADLPQYPVRFVHRVSRQIFIMLCTWQLFSNAHSAYVLRASVHNFLTFHYFFTDLRSFAFGATGLSCLRSLMLLKSLQSTCICILLYLYFTVLIMKMFSVVRPF